MKGRRGRAEPPRSARGLAFRILRRVEESGAYASVLLDRHESAMRDRRDASLLHELVLGVLRRRAVLDHALAEASRRPPDSIDPAVRTVLRLGAYSLLFLDRIPDFAAVDTAVELAKREGSRSAASFVNGVLRAVAARGTRALPGPPERGDVAALSLAQSHPEWWVRRTVDRIGWDETSRLLEANNRPAATVLRPNLRRTTPRDLQLRLQAEGVESEPCRYVPDALRVLSGQPQHTRSFREGLAWIQDEGSQLVPLLLGRPLRPRVADLCAAPGTKTLQLAEALPVGGTLVALDRHAARLRRLLRNAARVGAENVVALAADASAARSPLRSTYDHVLVDAPCSGTGTLRRHPEIRWRLREEDLAILSGRQGRILDGAAGRVAPGGSLLYAVCSLEPEEGESVIGEFLSRHPEFEWGDPRPSLSEPASRLVGDDGALRTSPTDGMDGFFACLLLRKTGADASRRTRGNGSRERGVGRRT